jgi:hypothetical protein
MAGGLLAAPLVAEGQQVGKVWRIGVLESTSPALNAANLAAFQQELRELGYVERQHYAIEYRSADSRPGGGALAISSAVRSRSCGIPRSFR